MSGYLLLRSCPLTYGTRGQFRVIPISLKPTSGHVQYLLEALFKHGRLPKLLYIAPLNRSQIDRKRVFIPQDKDLLIQPVLARVCELHVEVVNDFGEDEPHFRDCKAVMEGRSVKEPTKGTKTPKHQR